MSWLKFPWIIIKLMYIHLGYILMGLDHEYFYIYRGNCFYELHLYSLALGNYKKAQEDYNSQDPFIKSAIGFCYLMLGNKQKSLNVYREAYKENKHPSVIIGLICAELNGGNTEAGHKLMQELSERKKELDPYHLKEFKRIKKQLDEDELLKE